MKRNRFHRANQIIAFAYYAVTMGVLLLLALRGECNGYRLSLLGAAFVLPWLPKLWYRICKQQPVYLAEMIFNLFALAAVVFGSVLDGYHRFPGFDKLLHGLSGFLLAVIGMEVYYCKKQGRTIEEGDAPIVSMFAGLFAVTGGTIWEIYEYLLSFTGTDPQQVMRTGVRDTMDDMIVCTIGGLITAIICYRYIRRGAKGHKGLMMSLFRNIYDTSIIREDSADQFPIDKPS